MKFALLNTILFSDTPQNKSLKNPSHSLMIMLDSVETREETNNKLHLPSKNI